jgi:hypothetical protein
MTQELEYTVKLRNGVQYQIELRDKVLLEYHSKENNAQMLTIWTADRQQVLINPSMIIAIEKSKKSWYKLLISKLNK